MCTTFCFMVMIKQHVDSRAMHMIGYQCKQTSCPLSIHTLAGELATYINRKHLVSFTAKEMTELLQ